MYRKMAIALIVVGVFVVGYGVFTGSTAHASHCADSAYLAANPELLKVATCNEVTVVHETNVQRANDANAARYTGLASYYAANPELMTVSRHAGQQLATEVKLHRIQFPGR